MNSSTASSMLERDAQESTDATVDEDSTQQKSPGSENPCAICLEECTAVNIDTPCKHSFHYVCFAKWVDAVWKPMLSTEEDNSWTAPTHIQCPYCRTPLHVEFQMWWARAPDGETYYRPFPLWDVWATYSMIYRERSRGAASRRQHVSRFLPEESASSADSLSSDDDY